MGFQQNTNITVKKRIVFLFVLIFSLLTVIVGRYAWVQIVWSPQLQQWAKEQWTNDIQIAAKRGEILDTNGNPLAVSGNVERVEAFNKSINQAVKNNKITREQIADELAPILNMDPKTLLTLLNKTLPNGQPMSTISIARRISKEQGDKIRELNIPGILISEDTKRYYPNGTLASQVIGNTDIDGNGRAGLEYEYNSVLAGTPGRFMGETDPYHRELPYTISNYDPPVNGDNIVTTIDENVQYFVENILAQGLKEYQAKAISAIVMDPKTGAILAMANLPDYDPNNPIQGSVEQSMELWKNRMVNDNFEPGSILKVVTAAAALEQNVITPNETFDCTGSYNVAGTTIHCWKLTGHGVQTFPQILQNSCNIGFMMVGQKLGADELYKYYNDFGLGQKTNIDLPGEASGLLIPLQKVGPVELATESFGQSIAVTGIQYITALAAVANNGVMMQPHIVREITNTDNNGKTTVVKTIKPKEIKQVISPQTSQQLRNILESVVAVGTGKMAYIDGYHIGGKTGTAQVAGPNGVYENGKYICSFASLGPAPDPRFVVLVSIFEPGPAYTYAGNTAGPLTKQIYEDLFKYYNIPPDTSTTSQAIVPKVIIPEVRGMSLSKAQNILKQDKLDSQTEGNGSIISDVSPKPGMSVNENSKIILYLGNTTNSNSKVVVPDFTTMSKSDAQNTANSLGLKLTVSGNGVVVSQSIEAGTEVNKNTVVKVVLDQPAD